MNGHTERDHFCAGEVVLVDTSACTVNGCAACGSPSHHLSFNGRTGRVVADKRAHVAAGGCPSCNPGPTLACPECNTPSVSGFFRNREEGHAVFVYFEDEGDPRHGTPFAAWELERFDVDGFAERQRREVRRAEIDAYVRTA